MKKNIARFFIFVVFALLFFSCSNRKEKNELLNAYNNFVDFCTDEYFVFLEKVGMVNFSEDKYEQYSVGVENLSEFLQATDSAEAKKYSTEELKSLDGSKGVLYLEKLKDGSSLNFQFSLANPNTTLELLNIKVESKNIKFALPFSKNRTFELGSLGNSFLPGLSKSIRNNLLKSYIDVEQQKKLRTKQLKKSIYEAFKPIKIKKDKNEYTAVFEKTALKNLLQSIVQEYFVPFSSYRKILPELEQMLTFDYNNDSIIVKTIIENEQILSINIEINKQGKVYNLLNKFNIENNAFNYNVDYTSNNDNSVLTLKRNGNSYNFDVSNSAELKAFGNIDFSKQSNNCHIEISPIKDNVNNSYTEIRADGNFTKTTESVVLELPKITVSVKNIANSKNTVNELILNYRSEYFRKPLKNIEFNEQPESIFVLVMDEVERNKTIEEIATDFQTALKKSGYENLSKTLDSIEY